MRKRLRSQQITIDLPKPDSEVWVNLIVQQVEEDDEGNVLNLADRMDTLNKRLHAVGLESVTFQDPVTQQNHTISVYGLAQAITVAASHWIAEKHNAVVDEEGLIIIE